ncbi:MAG: aminotransferase class I/II-fold pyridoxal phosphate-dependent enzyme [Kiritimatiellaeota bacterium]|nr:aminotransferase class I/II-fold pyridoxal phosphate-dependent enzyme [Kiritimatiellota bacterium]
MTRNTNDLKSPRDSRVAEHVDSLPKSGIRDFFELVNSLDDVISLGIGEPDFVTPWHIREAAIYSLERGHTSYTSNLGLLQLREAVCEYVGGRYAVDYDPKNECIITVGVSEALDLLLRAIINPGDEIIYHEPCYVSYSPCIQMAYGTPVVIPTLESDEFALNPDDLRHAITDRTKAILLNFPCNPTGASMPIEKLREVAQIAEEHDLIVITDEIYSELTYDGEHVSIASLPNMKERVVFLHGFSKAYAMTGFRIAYACGPRDLIDAMMKVHQYSMLCAPTIAQEAAVEALTNGEREMEMMMSSYRDRRNVIVRRLNDMGLSCVKPKGAFYAFANITSTGLSCNDFAIALLKEHNVAVVPGTAFGQCGEGFIRCAYATSLDDIQTAMDKMELFVARNR